MLGIAEQEDLLLLKKEELEVLLPGRYRSV